MRLPGVLTERALTSDDWYTPSYIFDALGIEFDLDPAAPKGGVPWLPAARHYSEDDDGLLQPWAGNVWLNPPYSKPGPWMARLRFHGWGVALVPADTAAGWWAESAVHADGWCFLRHRVQFVQPDNANVTSARFPSVLVAFGATNASTVRGCGLGWSPGEHTPEGLEA